jgi:hypothetical protein
LNGVAGLLGNGDGTFQEPLKSTLSISPGYFATTGDFNADGKLDIVYRAYAVNTVTIVIGNGDGTFQSGSSYPTDGNSGNVVLADFNSDGKLDFAVPNLEANTVNVFLGAQFSGLYVTSTHTGYFLIGQTGAVYLLGVSNPALTSSSGTVTVTDTLPAGLIATAISGSGWNCVLGTLTCTRSDALLTGNSYPPITVTVNVSNSLSPSSVTNRASVTTGAGTNAATDPTAILAASAFFNGQASLGSGVYYLKFPNGNLFGYYNYQVFPILYHYDMGFEVFVDGGNGAAYFYDFTSGHWWYTSPSLFPFLYDFTLNNWLYYFPATNNPGHYTSKPRYFSDLTTGKIVTMSELVHPLVKQVG